MERPMIYFVCALIFGIITALLLSVNFFAAFIIAAFFIFVIISKDGTKMRIITIFFLLGFFSFILYYHINVPGSFKARIVLKKETFAIAKYKNRKILLYGDIYEFNEGDLTKIYGKTKKEKDYFKGIVANVYVENHVIYKKDIIAKIYSIKLLLYNEYKIIVGKDKAGTIMAACFGDTKYISYSQKEDMSKMGICHIMAVSGFHIAIVYGVLQRFLGISAIVPTFIYLIITGMKSSSIRAFIMLALIAISKSLYKSYDALSALSFSALVLLFFNPYYICDMGFILSFLATLGIILYYNKIKLKLRKLPSKLNESISLTLSAQIFSMPFLMMEDINVRLISILGNLFIIPLYSLIIIMGNIGSLVVKIKPLFKIICYCLSTIITAVNGGSALVLQLSPQLVNYAYLEGIVVILIYMCYIFVIRGYENIKFIPLIAIIFLIFYKIQLF
ncbi:ComEC/Rec2 family competence protein [Clostridium grantii]|uniref:Competence protein ComEC n=1 Tax=Clostridium grantii DSM 8605 TaxID=1121316 RepID=A0A1M5XKJ4_9CLOT|nr:ComEC/Rec2 family competence protein [Clostridium grantii]SHI00259.1 competence protein ComEC [Clostridium grantii DSM 8605]